MAPDDIEGPIVTLIEFTIDPARLDEFSRFMATVAPGTRDYPGNRGFDAYADPHDPAHIIHRVAWENVEVQKQYMQWREATGVFDAIRAFIVTGPSLVYWRWVAAY